MEFFEQHFYLTFILSSLTIGISGAFASASLSLTRDKRNIQQLGQISVLAILIGAGVFGQSLSWRGLDREDSRDRLIHRMLSELRYNTDLKRSSRVLMGDKSALNSIAEFIPTFRNQTMYEVLQSGFFSLARVSDSSLLVLTEKYIYRSDDLNERIQKTEALFFARNDTAGLAESRKNMLTAPRFKWFLDIHDELVRFLFKHYNNKIHSFTAGELEL